MLQVLVFPYSHMFRCFYPLVIQHSHGKWPIETDDFPSWKPPFISGIFQFAMLVIARW